MDYNLEKELLEHVVMEDIPYNLFEIAELIGIEHTLKLCQYVGGDEMYFPIVDTVLRNTRNRIIKREFNGYNLPELSKKYKLTKKQLKNILGDNNTYNDKGNH